MPTFAFILSGRRFAPLADMAHAFRAFFTVGVFALLSTSPALASPKSCPAALNDDYVHRRIEKKLLNVPEVKAELHALLEDPDVPENFKRTLRVALIETDVDVVNLTARARSVLKVPRSTFAYADSPPRLPFITKQPMTVERMKQKVSTAFLRHTQHLMSLFGASGPADNGDLENEKWAEATKRVKDANGRRIYVTDGLYDARSQSHSLLALFHELAHLRFENFMARNYRQFLKLWPKHFIWEDGGKVYINEDFYIFLDERFAFESHLKLETVLNESYFKEESTPLWEQRPEAERIAWNSRRIIQMYELKDSRLDALAEFPLPEIFLGKPFSDQN